MEKLIKNIRTLEKTVMEKIKYNLDNYKLYLACYSSYDSWDNAIITDLEINIYVNGEYEDTITICTIEEKEVDWDNQIEKHREKLYKEKIKVYKYLKDRYNIEFKEDYTV